MILVWASTHFICHCHSNIRCIQITLVHYQLLNSWSHEPGSLIPRTFENGNKERLFIDLKVQTLRAHLHLIGCYSDVPGFVSSRSIARSVHPLCNTFINSSFMDIMWSHNCYIICWLSIDKKFRKCDKDHFPIFWVGPGNKATDNSVKLVWLQLP